MNLFKSIIPDLKQLKSYEIILLSLFSFSLITFSFIDFNAIKPNSSGMSIYKWTNDKNNGRELWEQIIMCTSGIAAFTGAMSVVMTAKGLYSSYFWGYINVIFYGVYAFVYGYSGDAQLNILFFLPLMIYGQYNWNKNMGVQVVKMRHLSFTKWIIAIIALLCIGITFYFEIPKFSKALVGYYLFDESKISVPRVLDSSSNALSIVAQFLLNGRYMEQWIFWIGVNSVQIAMFSGVAGFGIDINILTMLCLYQLNAIRGLYIWSKKNLEHNKKNKGLIVGKFYPFHIGHKYLIETGLEETDFLTVVVVCRNNEIISGEARYDMIKKTFNDQINSGKMELKLWYNYCNRDADSQFWALLALKWTDGFKPNIVFTSEKYGDMWAKYIGCQHKLVDLSRKKYYISGTMIRSNPYKYWDFLPQATRDYYRIVFVMIGSESTGKTSLCNKIAETFNAPYIPEYAREYIKTNDKSIACDYVCKSHVESNNSEAVRVDVTTMLYDSEDFIKIAKKQEELIENTIKNNPDSKIIISDTDGFVTGFWFDRYLNLFENDNKYYLNLFFDIYYGFWSYIYCDIRNNKHKQKNHKKPKDLKKYEKLSVLPNRIYIYSRVNTNTPFVQDGYRDGESIRPLMDRDIKNYFDKHTKIKYIELIGTYNVRTELIINYIRNILIE